MSTNFKYTDEQVDRIVRGLNNVGFATDEAEVDEAEVRDYIAKFPVPTAEIKKNCR